MKLMSFISQQRPSFGVVEGDRVIDLGLLLGGACPDLRSLLQQGSLDRIRALVPGATADFRIDEVTFLPVIPNPQRIICVGLNYLAHRLEGSHKPASPAPVLFMRLPESQVGHERPMVCPCESDQFDFEAEVAVIIGKAGRRIAESQALSIFQSRYEPEAGVK